MALAPFSTNNVIGSFTEKSFGNFFDFALNPERDLVNLPHIVFVGGVSGSEYRYADVKKTVAYIAVDEDEFGDMVIEKWDIRGHRVF